MFRHAHRNWCALTLFFGCMGVAITAQTPDPHAGIPVRHVIGLGDIKHNARGNITVQNGEMQFQSKTGVAKVPAASIEDIQIGSEMTQGGGTAGRVAKTGAIAAPYGSGAGLTVLLRTRVDMLTVVYHDPEGGLHGAIFGLPKGQAELIKTQLVAQGAHAKEQPAPAAKEPAK